MGVYIKGVHMPVNCSECPASLSGKYCNINETCATFMKVPFRPSHCPLVEVPEPHGRLIDAADVYAAIHERLRVLQTHREFLKKHGDIDLAGVFPYISKIPTVIEEEKNK